MNFTNDFEKREYLGRQGLLELQKLYPEYFKHKIQFTTGTYDAYDCYYMIIDEESLSIKKRVIIEIKIRDTNYDEYLVETKKINSLLKIRENLGMSENEMIILYINFTPSNTQIFNIDKIKDNIITTLLANKRTSISRTEKVNKKVIMLKPEDGKVLPYILNEKDILTKTLVKEELKVIEKRIIKGLEIILFK